VGVGPVKILAFALEGVLAVLALILARADRRHRALGGFALFVAVTEWARAALIAALVGHPRPYHGFVRVIFHADELLYFGWYAALVAVVLHYFARARVWPVFVAWLGIWVYCLDYPRVSRQTLLAVYRAATATAVLVTLVAIGFGLAARRVSRPSLAHLIVGLFVSAEVATLAAAVAPDFFNHWPAIQYAMTLTLSCAVAAHVWWLVRRRRTGDATP